MERNDHANSNNLWIEKSPKKTPIPAEIESVEEGSIGAYIGLEPGDKILKINGIIPRDVIDYNFLIVEEDLSIEVIDSDQTIHTIEIEKETDDNLGISFKEALFDGLKQCNNNCPFCFIDQQPSGKRKTLYIKDDDYRMSFLYGSYLTLTNLNEGDWERIKEQRLSPLFVSVHSTDPSTRSHLLKNPRAGLLMNQLAWFASHKLQIHAQVVVCPGINDGELLNKTINDLASFAEGEWPAVISTAIVPVGLTRFRPKNDGLSPVTPICAEQVINQVERMQEMLLKKTGSRFAWLSDEWYLIAGQPLPPRSSYEEFPQQENGVGSIRSFLKEMSIATENLPKKIKSKRTCSWVVGRLVEKSLSPTCITLNQIEGLKVNLYGLASPYWGQDQVVTGLLTGKDLIEGLKGQELGDELLLPSIMLKQEEDILLDDMTIEEVSKVLDTPIKIVGGADDIVAAAIGERIETSLSS